MKKKVWDHALGLLLPGANKILLKMKLTLCIILFSFLGAMATDSYSQTTKLTLDLKNTSVRDVLGSIENQSEFFFLYSEKIIDVNRAVNMEVRGSTIENILDRVFAGTNVNYTVKGRQIILTTPESNLFEISSSNQQQKSVSGKVTDTFGGVLPGVTVIVKETKIGTTTDINGNFSLEIGPTAKILVFSFVGMKPQEVTIGENNFYKVVMEEETVAVGEVVVTGVFDKRKKIDASVAITTLSPKSMEKLVANSAADLLKNVPGVYVNSSLGEIRNTVYSRGVSAGSLGANGYYYVSMQEDGLPVTNVTFTNYGPDFFLRADATVGRLEAVRGGTASILGANAPGGIFNYVMKEGGDKTEGEIRTRFGLEGNGRNQFYRTDINVGGPMGKNWFWDAGGFYRYDEGNSYPGYPMNKGGQFRANVVKKYKTGSFKVYLKYLNDRNGWQQFLPTVDFQKPKVLSGFHNYSAVASPSIRQDFLINQTGRFEAFNSEDMTHNQDKSIGSTWEQRLGGGWTFNNSFRYTDKITDWNTGMHANYLTMTDLVSYLFLGTLGQPGTYSFRSRSTGEEILGVNSFSGYDFTVVNGSTPGSDWSPNSFLFLPMLYNNQKAKESLDQFSFTKKLDNMSFTMGGFLGHSKLERMQGVIGSGLGLIQENPVLVDVTRTNPNGSISHITNSNGLFGVNGPILLNNATQDQAGFFFGHNWQMTSALNLDWGVRYENVHVEGQNSPGSGIQSTTGGIDHDPLTLYDNGISSTPQSFGFDKSLSTFSYSAGLNYKIRSNFAVYGRVSQGKKAPDFDTYFTATSDFLVKGLNPSAQKVFQVEGGVKVTTGKVNLFVTPFYSVLSNVPNVQWFENTDRSSYFTPVLYNKFRTLGVEVEGDYTFAKYFNIRGALTLQKGKAVEFNTWLQGNPGPEDDKILSYSGTEQDNLPRAMLNITPSFNIKKFFAQLTWNYLGKRQANVANAFQLPAFSQFNFSSGYDLSKHVNLGLVVNNILNTYGIMMWARPGGFVESLDQQGFTKELYEQNKDRVYTSSGTPPRSFYLTATFRF